VKTVVPGNKFITNVAESKRRMVVLVELEVAGPINPAVEPVAIDKENLGVFVEVTTSEGSCE